MGVTMDQNRNNVHGEFVEDPHFEFEGSELYFSNGPAVMHEVTKIPDVAFHCQDIDKPKESLNLNSYATRKTISQGLLDISLLVSNAALLSDILQVGEEHEYFILLMVLILTSVFLQIVVLVILLIIGGLDINKELSVYSSGKVNDQ